MVSPLIFLPDRQSASRRHLVRWKQLVSPAWLADLTAGKPVIAAPAKDWRLFEVDQGIPEQFLRSHIPGAAYIDTNRLEQGPYGTMKAAGEIRAFWEDAGIRTDQQTTFYCGTGWRASVAFFYAWLTGWEHISVYDGGWYEWSADPHNPTVCGERNPDPMQDGVVPTLTTQMKNAANHATRVSPATI